ncbi:MAG: hypothetical protein AAB817_00290 [Patescibacteria group bacterium]
MFFTIIGSMLKSIKYVVAAAAVTAAMFGVSYYLMVFNTTSKSMVTYALMNGLWYTIISLILTGGIALLVGINVALWLFRRDIIDRRTGSAGTFMGSGGAISGLLAAGCPTCGAPLLALFGAPLALMSLTWQGLELKVASLLLLFLSTYWLAENIYQQISGSCRLPAHHQPL